MVGRTARSKFRVPSLKFRGRIADLGSSNCNSKLETRNSLKPMVARIIEILSGFIVATISTLGYSGVVLLMAIESACIPLPSEIIMPFAGSLVYKGEFNLWAVGVAGAVGCVL